MRAILKWLGIGIGSLLGLVILAAIFFRIAGGRIVDKVYDPPETTFVANTATADIEEGRRAALLRGCFEGCHGKAMEGEVFNDDLIFGKFVAPDLTRVFREMTDAELDRAIRHGIRRDGRTTMIMPSSMLYHLSDEDLNNITVFIRSETPSDGPDTVAEPGLGVYVFVTMDWFTPHAPRILEEAPWLSESPEAGEYLAVTVCSECHGMDLRGQEDFSPSLAAVLAYSLEDFRKLMREGIALGGRELDLMSAVAESRFQHFSDDEIIVLHAYLQTLAQ